MPRTGNPSPLTRATYSAATFLRRLAWPRNVRVPRRTFGKTTVASEVSLVHSPFESPFLAGSRQDDVDPCKPRRLLDWQIAQQKSVKQRKDRCVCSDSQRQSDYHRQAENRVPAHGTQCIAHILANRFDRRYRPPFPVLLLHPFHAPKAAQEAWRASAGLIPARRLSSVCISR